MVIQKKAAMPVEEEEDPDFDEEEMMDEDPDFEQPKKQMSKPQPLRVANTNKFAPKQVEQNPIYQPVHIPTYDGLLDKNTGKAVTGDLWEVLAMILNKLDKIQESIG